METWEEIKEAFKASKDPKDLTNLMLLAFVFTTTNLENKKISGGGIIIGFTVEQDDDVILLIWGGGEQCVLQVYYCISQDKWMVSGNDLHDHPATVEFVE